MKNKQWDDAFNAGLDGAIQYIQKHVYGYLYAKRDGEKPSPIESPMDVWIPRLLAIALEYFEGWQKPKMRRIVTLEMLLANLEASRKPDFWYDESGLAASRS